MRKDMAHPFGKSGEHLIAYNRANLLIERGLKTLPGHPACRRQPRPGWAGGHQAGHRLFQSGGTGAEDGPRDTLGHRRKAGTRSPVIP